jgi:outer membrane cobalamin receptor
MHDACSSSARTTSLSSARPTGLGASLTVAALSALLATPAAADPVRGRVFGPDGQPAAGATVTLSGSFAAPRQVTTDVDGRYAADVPAGLVVIRAFAPGLDAVAEHQVTGETAVDLHLQIRAVSETLTVTASHVETPLSLAGHSISVITRDDLEAQQTRTLGDALRLVPGFGVARNGGPGSVTSVFPRGGESDFTLVLVDGVRANSFGGGMDLSQIPVVDVERIEVVRGPQSALYGADAIGGVIHIVTGRRGPAEATGWAEVGGRGTMNAAAGVHGGRGEWRGGASISRQHDDGFTGIADADGTRVTNDDSALVHGSASAAWTSPDGREAGAQVHVVQSDRGSPGPFGANPVGNFGGVNREARSLTNRQTAAVHAFTPLGGAASRVRLRADADLAQFDSEFRSAFPSRGSTERTHGRVQADLAATAAWSASAGADIVRESGRSTFITAGPVEVPVDRGTLAAFAEGRWQPAARGSVTVGVRAERITREALAANPSAFSPRPAFDDDVVVSVNPKVSAVWTLVRGATADAPSTRIRAAAGTGIRPPDAFEIAFTDNPGLEPERNVSVEGGLVQTWMRGSLQAEATFFHNRYEDLIVSIGRLASTSRYQTDNIANARARGAELAVAWRSSAALSARAHYTFLDSEILAVDGGAGQAPAPFAVGDRLVRRPRHQGAIDAMWTTRRVELFATAALRGETLDVEPNFGASGGLFENPGMAIVTAGGAWTLHPRLVLHARVVNAFDAEYEDVLGFPGLRRTLYAGLRVALRR